MRTPPKIDSGMVVAPPARCASMMATASAPIVGLFAVSARAGNFNCGFFEALTSHRQGIAGFVLRFATLALPFGALAGYSAEQISAGVGGLMMGGGMGA